MKVATIFFSLCFRQNDFAKMRLEVFRKVLAHTSKTQQRLVTLIKIQQSKQKKLVLKLS